MVYQDTERCTSSRSSASDSTRCFNIGIHSDSSSGLARVDVSWLYFTLYNRMLTYMNQTTAKWITSNFSKALRLPA